MVLKPHERNWVTVAAAQAAVLGYAPAMAWQYGHWFVVTSTSGLADTWSMPVE